MTATPTAHSRPGAQRGPHLGMLAVVVAVLFLVGLFVAAAVAHGFPPAPTASAAAIQRYASNHRAANRISAFFELGAAVPLAIYAATANARLHQLGVRTPGATIALAGGLLASAMLLLNGLLSWVVSRPETVADPAVVRALVDLGFAAGGPGHVVPLGLLVAGIAVPGLLVALVPRPLAVAGLVLAVVCELSSLSLVADGFDVLLPIGRFLGLAWLIAVGFTLPTIRPRRVGAAA